MTQKTSPPSHSQEQSDPSRVRLAGDWILDNASQIEAQLGALPKQAKTLDATGIGRLDSAGVLYLIRYADVHALGHDALSFRSGHQALVHIIDDVGDDQPIAKKDFGFVAALARLGEAVCGGARSIMMLIGFLGENLAKLMRTLRQPRRFRPTAVVAQMEEVGLNAVPLVALLSFLVGAVIAFLGATVLRDFGAEIYVVDLVNIAFLRELAPLVTAIVLAGRTASAFTAQIGAMKSREEIDAILTLGMDPIDLLVIPRLLALLIMLPLLTFISDLAGLAGGAMVGTLDLDVPWPMYLTRMHDSMELRHLLVGLSKAPVFAMVIGLIGCLEGLQVAGTAQSVGERTTSSVVQSISLVIVIDAFAAIWFMHMGW
ncbi:MAG: MlaE family lipid ABC transporter permease subunit [Xanthomonadaceae bacterium]|jgi:phospholipid/cholesterol/gamma-HCH transport system permease protein|nr:MlaE family lipid ABC transporter permease subunit [Xanthomonadaceae bacterium]